MSFESRRQRSTKVVTSLECLVCGSRNYKAKRPKVGAEPLVLKKYCKACDAHTEHRESK